MLRQFNALLLAFLMALGMALPAVADTAVDPGVFVAGNPITAAGHNNRFAPLYNTVNGLLTDTNIKAGALINPAKLDFTKQIGPILRAAAANCFAAGTTGDSEPRFAVTSDGHVKLGAGGASTLDLLLKRNSSTEWAFRNAADNAYTSILADDGTFADDVSVGGDLSVTGTFTAGSTSFSALPTFPVAATDTALLGPVNSTTGAAPSSAAPTQRTIDPRDIPIFKNDIFVSTTTIAVDGGNGQTLYANPLGGDQITLYNVTQGKWITQTFAQASIAVPNTTDTNYDLFASSASATTITLTATQWTNDTTRASAITYINGRWVKSSDHGQLLVATFRTHHSLSGYTGNLYNTNDRAYRLIDNIYNDRTACLQSYNTTDSWTNTSTSWAMTNDADSTDTRVCWVSALGAFRVNASMATEASHSAATPAPITVGIGYDTTTTPTRSGRSDSAAASDIVRPVAFFNYTGAGAGAEGFHYLQGFEAAAGATTTFYGDAGATDVKTCLTVTLSDD